jgi:MAM domain-containing protein meprin/A5/mu/flagellar hook capping protein FlgD/uncharacterized protein DUF4394/HYDIN/CFA65/VesB family protein/BACON domain-containing protein
MYSHCTEGSMKLFTFFVFVLIFCISPQISIVISQEVQETSTGLAPRSTNLEFKAQPMTPNIEFLLGDHAFGIDAQSDALWRISLSSPQTPTVIGPVSIDLFGGDFDNNGIFYASDYYNSELVIADTSTGSTTTIGWMQHTAGESFSGLAWDQSTGTMYAASTNIYQSSIYTVDLTNGSTSLVGTTTTAPGIIDIAINLTGDMYAHCIVTDAIYSVNKTTGAATLIGSTGFNANFAQGMDFNTVTGELFLAAYNQNVGPELRVVDLSTGMTTLIGPLASGSQVAAFAIPGILGDDLDPNVPKNVTLYSDYSTPSEISLSWDDPSKLLNGTPILSSDFTIEIERDSVFLTSIPGGTEYYSDMTVVDGTLYKYSLYTKLISNDSTSYKVNKEWTAGGGLVPSQPIEFYLSSAGGVNLYANWKNPTTQIDGTPLDDFAGIYLYEDSVLIATFNRTSADTGLAESEIFTPVAGLHEYFVSAFDNEIPSNESIPSNVENTPQISVSPLSISDTIFTNTTKTHQLSITNLGNLPSNLRYIINESPPVNWLSVSPDTGIVSAGQTQVVNITLDATGLSTGLYANQIRVFSNDLANPEETVTVLMVVNEADPSPPDSLVAYSDYSMPNSMQLIWADPVTLVNGNLLAPSDFVIEIQRDSAFLATVPGGTESYNDLTVIDGINYNYTLFAKLVGNNLISTEVNVSWFAGGSPIPDAAMNFYITDETGGVLSAHWISPTRQEDGTILDDFAGVNLYENGILHATFSRTPADTGIVDSRIFVPSTPGAEYYVTAIDNETPINESVASNTAFAPISIPYTVDFDAGFPILWTNESDDDFDWTRDNFGTSSSGTGPTVDHTVGTSAGYYMYTESSSPNYPYRVANLTTPSINIGTTPNPIMTFWYHMYGMAMGELHVDVLSEGTWYLDQMNPLIGQQQVNQSDPWLQIGVDLSVFSNKQIKIRFRGITGDSYTSDMAIDDVSIFSATSNPQIQVNPISLTDTLMVGDIANQQLIISNIETSFSSLNFSISENPNVSWLSVEPDSGGVFSGQNKSVNVNFDASGMTAGLYNTQLDLVSNDPVNPLLQIPVILLVEPAPIVGFLPDSMLFTLNVGMVDSSTMTITNTGAGVLDFILLSLPGEIQSKANIFSKIPVMNESFSLENARIKEKLEMEDELNSKNSTPPKREKQKSERPLPSFKSTAVWTEDFEGGIFPPQDWQVIDNAGTGVIWEFAAYWGEGNYCGSGEAATASSDAAGSLAFDTELWTPLLNIVDPVVTLTYDVNYQNNAGIDFLDVDISADEGTNWTNILSWNEDHGSLRNPPGEHVILDLTPYLNNTNSFILRWHYYQSNNYTLWYSQIDNVVIEGAGYPVEWLSSNPNSGTIPSGGQMDVQVIANTAGMVGGDYFANMTIISNDPVTPQFGMPVHLTAVGTPSIAADTDSLFFNDSLFVNGVDSLSMWIFSTGNGVLNITDITSDNSVFFTNNTQFTIPPFDSTLLTVYFNPDALGLETGTLTIISDAVNTPSVYVILNGGAITGPQMQVTPSAINESIAMGDSLDVVLTLSNIASTGSPVLDWTAKVEYPNLKTEAGQKLLTDYAYGFEFRARDFISISLSSPQMPQVLGPAGSFYTGADFNDKGILYAIDGNARTLVIFDQNTCSSTTIGQMQVQGNEMWTGLSWDPVTKKIYALSSDFGSVSTLYTVNTLTAATTLIGTTNVATGLVDISFDEFGNLYTYDPPTNNLYTLDKTDGSVTLIGSLGCTVSPYSHQGMDFDPNTGDLYLTCVNDSSYEAELRIVDLVTGNATLVGQIGSRLNIDGFVIPKYIPEYVELFGTTFGNLNPGSSEDLTVRLRGLENIFKLDTTITANIAISSNDPNNDPLLVPVTLNLTPSGIEDELPLPTIFEISSNYPNPFNPVTNIKFQLPQVSEVKLVVYNMIGQKIRMLVDGSKDIGYYNVQWDGKNDHGKQVATGIYIYRFEAGEYIKSQKMILMK